MGVTSAKFLDDYWAGAAPYILITVLRSTVILFYAVSSRDFRFLQFCIFLTRFRYSASVWRVPQNGYVSLCWGRKVGSWWLAKMLDWWIKLIYTIFVTEKWILHAENAVEFTSAGLCGRGGIRRREKRKGEWNRHRHRYRLGNHLLMVSIITFL